MQRNFSGNGGRYANHQRVGRYAGGYYQGGDGEFDAGAGVAALAAGAIIGGVIVTQAYGSAGYGGNSVAYCEQRYRSYDPSSGTYLGYDGYRHACP